MRTVISVPALRADLTLRVPPTEFARSPILSSPTIKAKWPHRPPSRKTDTKACRQAARPRNHQNPCQRQIAAARRNRPRTQWSLHPAHENASSILKSQGPCLLRSESEPWDSAGTCWIDWPLIGGIRGLECAQDVLSGAAAGIEPASGLELFKSCLVEGSGEYARSVVGG